MSEEFGSDYITIVDDDGEEFELEVLDSMDYNGESYVAFLPANMAEDDPDYGIIILRVAQDENGEELSYEECVEIMNAADAAAATDEGEKKPRRGRYTKRG